MGDSSCLADSVDCYSVDKIIIGRHVVVSQGCFLCTATHDFRDASFPLATAAIRINDQAWICARAYVGPGVTVGEGAVVGACTVVARDVLPWSIVSGNPARETGKREIRGLIMEDPG